MKLKIKLSILILLIVSLESCNLFFSSPHGRENLDDEAAQITAFTAVPSSDNSAVTMWNWKEPPSWINDDRITEIKIQHSILGYPENLDLFFGESFTDNSTWQHEWKDLTPNITHYFSLFAKSTNNDGNDIWYAPIKAKVKLPGTAKTATFGFLASLQVKDSGSSPYVESTTNPIVVQNIGPPNFVHVVQLDIPQHISIVKATIVSAAIQGSTQGIYTPQNLRVFPMRRGWNNDPNSTEGFDQLDNNTRSDYAVDDTVSAFFDSTANTVNDVTDVLRKAVLYGTNEIIFRIDGTGSTNTNSIGSSFVVIEYYTN